MPAAARLLATRQPLYARLAMPAPEHCIAWYLGLTSTLHVSPWVSCAHRSACGGWWWARCKQYTRDGEAGAGSGAAGKFFSNVQNCPACSLISCTYPPSQPRASCTAFFTRWQRLQNSCSKGPLGERGALAPVAQPSTHQNSPQVPLTLTPPSARANS